MREAGRGEHQGESTGLLLCRPSLRDLYHHSELDKNQQGEHGDGGYMTNQEAKNKAKRCE